MDIHQFRRILSGLFELLEVSEKVIILSKIDQTMIHWSKLVQMRDVQVHTSFLKTNTLGIKEISNLVLCRPCLKDMKMILKFPNEMI